MSLCRVLSRLVIALSIASVATAQEARPFAPRDPGFVPLGVYWAGEHTYQDLGDEDQRWQRIERALDDLRSHHVNTLWVTHLSAAETARIARLAEPRGIALVASLAELAGEIPHTRKGDHAALIEQTRVAWGDAPKPLLWGLGDEPSTEYMEEITAYVKNWKTHWPDEPVTTVVTWGNVPAASRAGFDRLSSDVYPFFGSTGGYPTTPANAWRTIARRMSEYHPRPWMMGQAFQEPKGPFTADKQGNVVFLPDGKPHWVMPTPAQVSWQAWSAFAEGARGVVFFLYRWPVDQPPEPPPATAKNSGSPRGLTYPDGRETPQYAALGKAYGHLQRLSPTLAKLARDPEGFAAIRGKRTEGTFAQWLRGVDGEQRYLMVVAGFEGDAEQRVTITVGPEIQRLTTVLDDREIKLTTTDGLREAVLTLTPGRGELLLAEEDDTNRPQVYRLDLASDGFQQDVVASQKLKRYETSLEGNVLSAEDATAAWPTAGMILDLNKRLASLPTVGIRTLSYRGHAVGPDKRGVRIATSSDGKAFRDVSQNEFEQAILARPRFLRITPSWHQAGNFQYGYLSDLTIWQWKRAAEKR